MVIHRLVRVHDQAQIRRTKGGRKRKKVVVPVRVVVVVVVVPLVVRGRQVVIDRVEGPVVVVVGRTVDRVAVGVARVVTTVPTVVIVRLRLRLLRLASTAALRPVTFDRRLVLASVDPPRPSSRTHMVTRTMTLTPPPLTLTLPLPTNRTIIRPLLLTLRPPLEHRDTRQPPTHLREPRLPLPLTLTLTLTLLLPLPLPPPPLLLRRRERKMRKKKTQ